MTHMHRTVKQAIAGGTLYQVWGELFPDAVSPIEAVIQARARGLCDPGDSVPVDRVLSERGGYLLLEAAGVVVVPCRFLQQSEEGA